MGERRTSPFALWVIAGVLIATNLSIITTGKALVREMRRGQSFYLCVELAKLGGSHPACAALTDTKPTRPVGDR